MTIATDKKRIIYESFFYYCIMSVIHLYKNEKNATLLQIDMDIIIIGVDSNIIFCQSFNINFCVFIR